MMDDSNGPMRSTMPNSNNQMVPHENNTLDFESNNEVMQSNQTLYEDSNGFAKNIQVGAQTLMN